jgi:hypothetical protein
LSTLGRNAHRALTVVRVDVCYRTRLTLPLERV